MSDSKLSPGFGEVVLIVEGVKVSYAYQIVEDRMYLDLGSKGPFALFGDAIISELAKLVDSMKQREGLKVILAVGYRQFASCDPIWRSSTLVYLMTTELIIYMVPG